MLSNASVANTCCLLLSTVQSIDLPLHRLMLWTMLISTVLIIKISTDFRPCFSLCLIWLWEFVGFRNLPRGLDAVFDVRWRKKKVLLERSYEAKTLSLNCGKYARNTSTLCGFPLYHFWGLSGRNVGRNWLVVLVLASIDHYWDLRVSPSLHLCNVTW